MRLQEIRERLEKLSPEPWELYRCDYVDENSACGLNGWSFDCSHDECHHPLERNDGEFIAHSKSDIEYLLNLTEKYEKSLKRIIALYNEYGNAEWIVSHGMCDIAEEALQEDDDEQS